MPFTPEFVTFVTSVRKALLGFSGRLFRHPAYAGLGQGFVAVLLAALHALVLVSVLGMAAFPFVVKRYLTQEASQALGRNIRLEVLRCNPFTFALTAEGFTIEDPAGQSPLARFSRLELNLDPFRLLDKRIQLSRFLLADPVLNLSRRPDGKTNFEDLLPRHQTRRQGGSPFSLFPAAVRFTVKDVVVTGGTLSFDDALTGDRQEVRDVHFALDFLASDSPGLRDVFTTGGKINESSLEVAVRADLAGPSPEIEFFLTLKEVALKRYMPYFLPLKRPLNMTVDAATLAARCFLPGREPGHGGARVEARGRVEGLSLLDGGDRVAGFEAMDAEGVTADLDSGSLSVERVAVSAPFLKVDRDEAGIVGLIALLEPAPESLKTPPEPATPLAVTVSRLEMTKGSAVLEDRGLDLSMALSDIDLQVDAIDMGAGRFKSLTATSTGDRFQLLAVSCGGGYAPLDLAGKASMKGIDLAKPFPAFKRLLPRLGLAGLASYEVEFAVAQKGGAVQAALNLDLHVREFKALAEGQSKPLVAAGRLDVKSARIDPAAQAVAMESVTLSNGGAALEHDAQGVFPAFSALTPGTRTNAHSGSGSWTVAAARASLAAFSLEYFDGRAGSSLRADVDELTVTGVSSSLAGPVGLLAKGRLTGNASFEASGEIRPESPSLSLGVNLTGLPLGELARVVPKLPLQPLNGTGSLAGRLNMALGKDGPTGSFSGDAAVSVLSLARPGTNTPFASVAGITVKGAEFSLEPPSFKAEAIKVDEPWLAMALDEAGKPVLPLEAGQAGGGQAHSLSFSYEIKRLEVDRGWLELTAQGYQPPLSGLISGIQAVLVDIQPDRGVRFDLALAAGHTGRLQAQGTAGWVSQAALLDFKATLRNLDLGELSPVSRRYTGFPIQRGMLGLKLDYKATPKALDLKNNILVTGIQLGPKSPEHKGKDLPLDLAVSLLTDGKGVIDLDIPISGDPSQARADLKDVISTAMAGAFARVFFAPLAVLNVQHGGGRTVYLPFAPGSAELTEESRKALDALVDAVADRPRLSLEVAAFVDPASEKEALAKALSNPPGGKAGRSVFLFRKMPGAPGEPLAPTQADWAKLARLRQDAVLEHLAAQGKLPQDRIFPLAADPLSPPPAQGQAGNRAEARLRY